MCKVEEAEAKAEEADRMASERITTFEAQVRQPAMVEHEITARMRPIRLIELR